MRLTQDAVNNLTMHIGQTILASLKFVGQLFMVHSQQMQDCRIKVVDMNGVINDVVAEFIRLTISDSALYSSTSEYRREAIGMMISPGISSL